MCTFCSPFPDLPLEVLAEACVLIQSFQPSQTGRVSLGIGACADPLRRATHTPGSVLVNCSGDGKVWVLSVGGRDVSLRSREVFQQMLRWALTGVFGGSCTSFPPWQTPGTKGQLRRSWGIYVGCFCLGPHRPLRIPRLLAVRKECLLKILNGESDDALPDDLADSEQVALWALRRAAARFQGVRKNWVRKGVRRTLGRRCTWCVRYRLHREAGTNLHGEMDKDFGGLAGGV